MDAEMKRLPLAAKRYVPPAPRGLAHLGYPRLPPPRGAPWPAGLARSRTVDARRYPGWQYPS